MHGSSEEDLAALRKLRDESECDEVKQAWSAEHPRDWTCDLGGEQRPCVQVRGDRVTALGLSFSSLAVLPDAIGELKALTTRLVQVLKPHHAAGRDRRAQSAGRNSTCGCSSLLRCRTRSASSKR